jgi:hypothetical protein
VQQRFNIAIRKAQHAQPLQLCKGRLEEECVVYVIPYRVEVQVYTPKALIFLRCQCPPVGCLITNITNSAEGNVRNGQNSTDLLGVIGPGLRYESDATRETTLKIDGGLARQQGSPITPMVFQQFPFSLFQQEMPGAAGQSVGTFDLDADEFRALRVAVFIQPVSVDKARGIAFGIVENRLHEVAVIHDRLRVE